MLEDRCRAGVVLDEYSTVGYVLERLRNVEQLAFPTMIATSILTYLTKN